MFSIVRQTHPATGIEHSVSCCFFNNEETCLVTAGANIMKVFRLYPEGSTKEVNAAGQPIPPKMKLECLASYTLWGNVMSLASVKCPSSGRDLLLVSFKEAKLSVVQYDPQTNNLITLSMHYFEEEDMKGGWTTHPHIPWIRVDPECRCAVMLLYGKKLAVLPFRKDLASEEGDPLEAKPLENKKIQQPQQPLRAPTLASYVIVLKDLDEKIDNIIDIQFLHGYYEPTLLLLYEPVRTFPGRTAVRSDTCALCGVSLNIAARVHPVIWAHSSLPFDCVAAVPVQSWLGGCLILAVNSLIYLNQSVPPYGVSLNSIASNTTNFPLRIQEGASISLDGACVAGLGPTRFALSLKGGQLYVLTLICDSVRSVRSFHLDRAAASVLTCTMCVIEEDFLFLGSRLGNSLLLRVTERENRMLFSVEKPFEATVDLTVSDSDKERHPTVIDLDRLEDNQAKKRRLENTDQNPIVDMTQDELEVYGSDIRTSTSLTSHVFEVCDSLLNTCPIAEISMGESALTGSATGLGGEARIELAACAGRGKNGALAVLQRSIAPIVLCEFHLPGCIDMWTVIGEPPEGAKDKDEATHAYLILTQEDSSMILQTGQEINEVDNSGFMSSAPTVFAGNLGQNRYMVQVTTTAVKLIKNGVSVQYITLEWQAASAHVADPYLCVLSTCGRCVVMALREFASKDGMSGRLAPTRQAVPHQPLLLKAVPYRDTSGLFTSQEEVQIKGEFTGKKKGKNVKAEGFKEGTVYELNDEDEQLYGGDQTPASMASILLQEQSSISGGPVPRRHSRWWRRAAAEHRTTWWLLAVRNNGNMELYALPEMRLAWLARDVCTGPMVLCDALESVPSLEDLSEDPDVNRESNSSADKLQEILMVGMGNKGSRVLLLIRLQDNLMIYQAFKYARGKLKLRFSRINITFGFGYAPSEPPNPKDSYELTLLKENVRQMRYFNNIGGHRGVLLAGRCPYVLLLAARGELRLHPLALSAPPVPAAAEFHNHHCARGMLYFNSKSELRICALPSHLSYEAPWPVRKVALKQTAHFVSYHVESKVYCLVLSTAVPTQTYYRFNGEDKERETETRPDRFPFPMQDKFSVCLFSPISWEIIPNTRTELEEWEHVTCLENVALSYEGTRSGLRGYIALGTNYNYSEDITSRGRIILYDIIDVVPEPGQPLTKNKFKELYAKEQKGPVTAMTQVLGFLITAVGQKIYLWQLKDSDLVGVAFIDTQIYAHRLLAVKNLILVGDVYQSVSLLRYQPAHRTLSLVARDVRHAMVYDMEFMVDNTSLGFLVSESEGNLALFMYQPQARESYGGQRLIRKSDYCLGQQIHSMFRIKAKDVPEGKGTKHVTMFATLDGGIGYVMPISERVYRRLHMLQNVMNNYMNHTMGLNPKAYRTYKSYRRACGSSPARGMLDGDLISLYMCLPVPEQSDIAKKIGTKVDEIFADLYEIDRMAAHF